MNDTTIAEERTLLQQFVWHAAAAEEDDCLPDCLALHAGDVRRYLERPQEPAGTPDLAELRALLAAADLLSLGTIRAEVIGTGRNQVSEVTRGHPNDNRERYDLFEDPHHVVCELTAALLNHAPALLDALEQQVDALRAVEALAGEWARSRQIAGDLAEKSRPWGDEHMARASVYHECSKAIRAALGRDGSADDA